MQDYDSPSRNKKTNGREEREQRHEHAALPLFDITETGWTSVSRQNKWWQKEASSGVTTWELLSVQQETLWWRLSWGSTFHLFCVITKFRENALLQVYTLFTEAGETTLSGTYVETVIEFSKCWFLSCWIIPGLSWQEDSSLGDRKAHKTGRQVNHGYPFAVWCSRTEFYAVLSFRPRLTFLFSS